MSNLITDGNIQDEIIRATIEAKRSIWLIIYTGHVPSARSMPRVQKLYSLLRDKALQGLDCRLLLAGWAPLSEQDKSNRFMAREFAARGWQVKHCKTHPICHPKLFIFDGQRAIVGSHNFTGQGLSYTKNLSVWVSDHETMADIDKYYLSIWSDDKYIQS